MSDHMKPTLVLLAAGMGSRYGGLKQLEAIGPNGQTMIEYAVADACRSGFGKVVFVIRKDFEYAFRRQVGEKISKSIDVKYAFQDPHELPTPHKFPKNRTKPWGTAHAVRAASSHIDGPFAVVNADDFYGLDAYKKMVAELNTYQGYEGVATSMVGYILGKTLSQHGTVNRGLCGLVDGKLKNVEEFTNIRQDNYGILHGDDPSGRRLILNKDAIVSMNFWGFNATIFEPLEIHFEAFLRSHGTDLLSEYYLPDFVDTLIREESVSCTVIETESQWFGVTYPQDKASVVEGISKLTNSGHY